MLRECGTKKAVEATPNFFAITTKNLKRKRFLETKYFSRNEDKLFKTLEQRKCFKKDIS